MAEYRFDCRKCTNAAYSETYGYEYCLPMVRGEHPIEVHDMGGTRKGDYLTCSGYTTEPRTIAIYETEASNG